MATDPIDDSVRQFQTNPFRFFLKKRRKLKMDDGKNNNRAGRDSIHWISALILIAVDNAFFAANTAAVIGTGGAGFSVSPVICFIAFAITTISVFFVQRFIEEEKIRSAFAKGLGLGVMAGVPTSVAGTIVGITVLAKAGIKAIGKRD